MANKAQVKVQPSLAKLQASSNACSLEAVPSPNNSDVNENAGVFVVGFYELDEQTTTATTTNEEPHAQHRAGGLGLYSYAPNSTEFEELSHTTVDNGVLDSKWRPASHTDPRILLAAGTSGGEIKIYEYSPSPSSSSSSPPPVLTELEINNKDVVNKYYSPPPSPPALVTSLCWGVNDTIATSHSNGSLSISSFQGLSILPKYHLAKAHTFRGTSKTAEVWSCAVQPPSHHRSPTYGDLLLSGGDDAVLKGFDLRQVSQISEGDNYDDLADGDYTTPRPIYKVEDIFESGVTCISWNPSNEHIIAVGSYDESVRIYDLRRLNPRGGDEVKTFNVGGGVWRLKWHCESCSESEGGLGMVLVGAMHGGCRVIDTNVSDANGSNSEDEGWGAVTSFEEHESMAYGADWLNVKSNSNEEGGGLGVVASCSFYDRRIMAWNA